MLMNIAIAAVLLLATTGIHAGGMTLAMRAIREVVIFRNNEIVFRTEPGDKKVELRWVDEKPLDVDHAWYYARIHAEDDELAWSSPIWFTA